MKELMHANLGCTMGGLYHNTIFNEDDIVMSDKRIILLIV